MNKNVTRFRPLHEGEPNIYVLVVFGYSRNCESSLLQHALKIENVVIINIEC
jgi:hypothetical protein